MNNNIFACIFTCQTIAIACGYVLDLIIGDPHWLYHPVRLIGTYISFLEKGIRKIFGDGERA